MHIVAGEPRPVCDRCRRPERVCYCRHITPLESATRVVILQHPRERDVPIGTARMANLCLPNSELHIGVHWQGSPALASAISDRKRRVALLYPGPGANDVVANPPREPLTLIVVDGTWSQTKKVVRENPELAALPRYAFTPPAPSEYRIRKEPDLAYVSTIEALFHVLAAIEPDGERFRALLRPFRAMVETQLEYAAQVGGGRHRRPMAPRAAPRVPPFFAPRADELVCVVGEANAWPYRSPQRQGAYPDELIQWAAHRVATGETFDFVLAPDRSPLSPRTSVHTGLSHEVITAGGSAENLFERWQAFVRDTDVICSWGRYATNLFAARGGYLPPNRVDLRQVARVVAKSKVGTVEEYIERIGGEPSLPLALGRAGVRLAQATSIVRYFCALARATAA